MQDRFLGLLILGFLTLLTPAAARAQVSIDPLWAYRCGDGRLDASIDSLEDPSVWVFCCPEEAKKPTITRADGCSGNAMAVDFDLSAAPYIVLQRNFSQPLDLGRYTHLRFAFRSSESQVPVPAAPPGSHLDAHHHLEIKLSDGKLYDGKEQLFTKRLVSATDLPVWRVQYIDFREFELCQGCPQQVDKTNIRRLEIGITKCESLPTPCETSTGPVGDDRSSFNSNRATLLIDEIGAVDLKPDAPNRLAPVPPEKVTLTRDLRSTFARAILNHQANHGLVPAWFDEINNPNYHSKAQAESLLVFVEEFERTQAAIYRDAANRLASRLLLLQVPTDRFNSGAWYTAYGAVGGILASRNTACTGNERTVVDIEKCYSTANTGWILIALDRLRRSNIYPNRPQLDLAITAGGAWIERQIGQLQRYPELVSLGIEANVQAYFGLLAAGRIEKARTLALGIDKYGWDPVVKRLRNGVLPADYAATLNLAGGDGFQFLRSTCRDDDARASQSFAASVFRTTSFDGFVDGYGDVAGPYTVSVQSTARAAAAGIPGAEHVMQHIYKLITPEGSLPGATDNWSGGPVGAEAWNTRMRGVSPIAWAYFAQNGDPLIFPAQLIPFSFSNAGFTCTVTDSPASVYSGYARLRFVSSIGNIGSSAIVGYKPDKVLITEFGLPATQKIQAGRIPVDLRGNSNTGLALANPSDRTATISFYFTNETGGNVNEGSLTIPPYGHIAKFLDQAPFNIAKGFSGSLTFRSDQPIGAVAIRGVLNERAEFLVSVLPIAELGSSIGSGTVVIPDFAAGAGWQTEVVLANPTDDVLTGTVQFYSPLGSTQQVRSSGRINSTFTYTLAPRSIFRLLVEGITNDVTVGWIKVVPANNGRSPIATATYSFQEGGVTVTQAGVNSVAPATSFRLYADATGDFGDDGSSQTGLAIANPSTADASIEFELVSFNGATPVRRASASIRASGQFRKFLKEIEEFKSLQSPFQGVLRITSSVPVAVTGLRGRYVQRPDTPEHRNFLIAATPASGGASVVASELIFPQLPVGGGYTPQIVLVGGANDSASGVIEIDRQRNADVQITHINGVPVERVESSGIGNRITIRGVAPSSSKVYVVVKPSNDPNWYIQPPINFDSPESSNWTSEAYLGEQNAGVGETFTVFAVLTNNTYEQGQRLSAPPSGVISNVVVLRRGQ